MKVAASPQKKEANLRPEGAEVGGGWRCEKERRGSSQVDDIREHPIHRCAVPLPQWGRLRYEDTAFLDTTPFLMGKAKRRRLRRQKGSQPRLAALGSPFQGKGLAWTLPPSYGRRCPEGAEVGGGKRYERERGNASQVRRLREHPIHRWRGSPSPMGKAKRCDALRP